MSLFFFLPIYLLFVYLYLSLSIFHLLSSLFIYLSISLFIDSTYLSMSICIFLSIFILLYFSVPANLCFSFYNDDISSWRHYNFLTGLFGTNP